MSKEDIAYFVMKLEFLINIFLKSTNAYHIVIKSIYHFNEQTMSNIYKIIAYNIIDISNHNVGCSAIQKCIDTAPQSIQGMFVGILSKNASQLIFNKYGYYVLCHAINKRISQSILEIVKILTCHLDFIKVCRQQQSRVVLEKCLEYSDSDTRKYIIDLMKNKEVFDTISETDSGIKGMTNFIL